MRGRRVRDAAEAREFLDQVAESGVDRAAWARAHGVDPRSLNAWRINLDRGRPARPHAGPGRGVLELVPRSAAVAGLTVRYGAFAIDVGQEFDEALLSRVLGVIASC